MNRHLLLRFYAAAYAVLGVVSCATSIIMRFAFSGSGSDATPMALLLFGVLLVIVAGVASTSSSLLNEQAARIEALERRLPPSDAPKSDAPPRHNP
jgi:hypothetical protein